MFAIQNFAESIQRGIAASVRFKTVPQAQALVVSPPLQRRLCRAQLVDRYTEHISDRLEA
ncbi:hypothetical protein ACLBX9_05315 [Methylobacterium sp. A49B]